MDDVWKKDYIKNDISLSVYLNTCDRRNDQNTCPLNMSQAVLHIWNAFYQMKAGDALGSWKYPEIIAPLWHWNRCRGQAFTYINSLEPSGSSLVEITACRLFGNKQTPERNDVLAFEPKKQTTVIS